MTARLMKVSGLAETLPVEKTRKPARPAAKPAATRRRAPAAKPAVAPIDRYDSGRAAVRARRPRPPPSPAGSRVDEPRRSRRGRRRGGVPLARPVRSRRARSRIACGDVHREARVLCELARRPRLLGGTLASRKLELTTTSVGTFVRYLPLNAPVGDSARAITVGTYPLRNAYATAVSRAKSPAMTSRETSGGGLVVWSQKLPTSVYLAFPGVPQLVEVYAPDADDARTLALSGRIRPVR